MFRNPKMAAAVYASQQDKDVVLEVGSGMDIGEHPALYGYGQLPPKILWIAAQCFVVYHMSMDEIAALYTKYIGDWGGTATRYRFEAMKDGKVVKTVIKTTMDKPSIKVNVSKIVLE